ncbi:MAG TPA: bifunctional diaminohydroxyphosphoribosylaminopyrimidine deaminase/5-amino-6-(5-phosphoribosylamino)uracil reductase RibD [Paracoccaceae bacterium]|nr:bifunctional diaminohydroxyphosphoribosylaminopyrimidine deaminase/5-amino-6-(5-phosphoribosylamino)uracil reductase RibD [Paracoccaceae bacterium]
MAPAARDLRFLAAAFRLAARGLGRVWPNPAVGCIIARGERVLGRGWTQPGGRPHAETMALAAAGEAAAGATAYITLEPCAHYGRTPPCTEALIAAGIARVVSTLEDPDARVSGAGFARLREAGIELVTGLMEAEARAANIGFLTRLAQGRPMVTLKLAVTIDGRIATGSGESRWVTGLEARRYAHLLRARHDGILIGAGTVRADDPQLDVRDLGLAEASPVRIVADGSLSLPLTSRLVATARQVPLWIMHGPAADPARAALLAEGGAELIECPADADGRLDLDALLRRLGERGMTRLLCEGGSRLAAALVARRTVERLVTVSAGKLVGGDGVPAVGPLGLARLAEAPPFRLVESRLIGADLLAVWESA